MTHLNKKKQPNNIRNKQDLFNNPTSSLYDVDAHKQRVTQTNMVYLIGLPESIADQNILKQQSYCGQYGPILKLLVKDNYVNDFSSYSAYITYENQQSASLAVLGLNNLTIQKNKIYASYGTNKYCSTFIRFGKCKKSDCPFLHKIQKHKQIRQQDNKKLFQDQQQLARKYFIQNYQSIDFNCPPNPIFPSKQQIFQSFINDGSIVISKDSEQTVSDTQNDEQQLSPRQNLLKYQQSTSGSIDNSPLRGIQQEENVQQSSELKIRKKIDCRIRCTKYSLFGFAKINKQNGGQFEYVTKHLKNYLLLEEYN